MTLSPLDLASIDEAGPEYELQIGVAAPSCRPHPVLDDFDPAVHDVLLKLGAEFQELSILLFAAKAHRVFYSRSLEVLCI